MATTFTRHHSSGLLSMGYVKDIVYRTKVRDITRLKQRLSHDIATFNDNMLQGTWQEIEYRLGVLRATNSAHAEVY